MPTNSVASDTDAPRLPAVSVVVPTYNSARTLRRCLSSIRDQQGVAVELIVVDPERGSTDDTPEVASQLADVFLVAGPERVAQRNAGLAAASHPLIAFIDSDMVLAPTVLAEAAAALSDAGCGGVVVDEEIVGQGFLIAGRRLEKRLYRGDAAAEAARVFRTEEVRAVGGYDPGLIVAEDFDLSDRVVAGRALGRIAAPIYHDEGRIRLRGMWAKKTYYGTHLRTFLKRAFNASGDMAYQSGRHRLFRWSLLRIPLALFRHPYAASALLLIKAVESSALAWGVLIGGKADLSKLRARAYPTSRP